MPATGVGGPAYWSPPLLSEGLFLNGVKFYAGRLYPLSDWGQDFGPGRIDMASRTTVLQLRGLLGNAPLNMRPMRTGLTFTALDEDDWLLVQERAAAGFAIPLYFDYELPDVWYIPGKASGQTDFRCSRWFPWNLAGITHITRPPVVMVDGVEQTIITTGTPTTGQAKVTNTGGAQGVVTVPAALTGTLLTLRYRPQHLVTIDALNFAYRTENGLEIGVALSEHLAGTFTGA